MPKVFDWEEHKKNIYENILSGAGKEKADAFIKHYSERYDDIRRPIIDWRLAYALMDDYHYCKRVGTRWFAFVGTGGTGKSTVLKNSFYWLDSFFQPDDLTLEVNDFIKKLADINRFDNMRALAMDEPDDDIHPQTEMGKRFRKVLGKARQGRYFFGICATDLTDIPPYIFRKIDVVVFTPYLGKFLYFKNSPRKKSYLVQRIRKEYQEKGYKVFFELQSEEGCIHGNTKKGTPWTVAQEEKYVKTKKENFETDIKELVNLIDNKGKPKSQEQSEIDLRIMKAFSKGATLAEVKKIFGVGSKRVDRIKREYNKRLADRMRESVKVNSENFVFEEATPPQGGALIKGSVKERRRSSKKSNGEV